ncbi:MAG: hypothetical protein EA356_10140 [Geminicoccaceae bacterium]|nr:MAG: hypothetical protein EA356_10140 [Geminicoccaceae bacterium]
MRRAALAAGALLVAGCAGPVPIERLHVGDPRDARIALEDAHLEGPVAVRIDHLPPPDPHEDVRAQLLAAAARGVPALRPRFELVPGEPVLVVAFDQPLGADPCSPLPPGEGPLQSVQFAFCADGTPYAAVRAPAEGDLERLYERLARTLFPDLYAERYGLGLGPLRIGLGGSFGFGR